MKTLAVGLLLFSISSLRPSAHLVPREPAGTLLSKSHRGGRWYLAENGHAVYCVGPVLTVNTVDGGLHKVATYCKGEKPLVPLKD
jgi:hypothetical protein